MIAQKNFNPRGPKEILMIGRATIFAIALMAPGFAFAADSAVTNAAPAAAAHETAGATTAKADVKADAKSDTKAKVAKGKGHKAKAGENKTEQKS